VFFGGRVAEEIVFDEMNTGASSDIQRASEIARRMVCEWGMSSSVGPVHYDTKEEHVFLGRDIGKPREHSEAIQLEIDQEVKRIIQSQYEVAKKIVSEHVEVLHNLAKAVMERETLDADDIDRIIRGEGLSPGPQGGPPAGGESTGSSVSVAA
jgi:cell division protease FtsH